MSYPVDQFAALARANFTLMLKLAEVARSAGQESLQIGNRAAGSFAAEARSSVAKATGNSDGVSGEQSTGAAIFSDMEQVRDHMLTGTRSAFEEWQQTWKDVASSSAGQGGGDAFAAQFKPWFGQSDANQGDTSSGRADDRKRDSSPG